MTINNISNDGTPEVTSGIITKVFPGLLLKDKLGHLHASPVYTQHLPYSQSSSHFNTRDHSSLHDLVPPYILPHSSYSLSSSSQPLASSYSSSHSFSSSYSSSQPLSSSSQPLASSYTGSSSRHSPSYTSATPRDREGDMQ